MSTYDSPTDGVTAVTAPQTVTVAYWLYIVGAILGLVGAVVVGVLIPTSITTASGATTQALQGQDTNGVDVGSAVVGVTIASAVFSIVLTVVFSVLLIVFARKMRAGRNWARIVLAVIAVLQLFGVLGAYGVGALHFLVVLAALILSFLPTSNAWFREVRATTPPVV